MEIEREKKKEIAKKLIDRRVIVSLETVHFIVSSQPRLKMVVMYPFNFVSVHYF